MMNQRTATCNTLLAVLNDRGVTYEVGGVTPISEVLTPADKAKARDILFAGFRKGEIEMSEESKANYAEDKEMTKYVSGLVNNWIRKAKEFNNGFIYEAKNPGSRAGSGDDKIKALKALLAQVGDEHKADVQAAIDERMAEIKPTTSVEIDASKLPEHLKHLVK